MEVVPGSNDVLLNDDPSPISADGYMERYVISQQLFEDMADFSLSSTDRRIAQRRSIRTPIVLNLLWRSDYLPSFAKSVRSVRRL